MSANFISSFVHIKNKQVFLNGSLFFQDDASNDFAQFIRSLYSKLAMSYPKFYKMDDLSKLSLLGAELLLPNASRDYAPEEQSIILNNRSASLDTDYKHQKGVDEGLVSPAIFVYTLPNICIGEIAIKHKIMGENSFIVSEQIDIPNLYNYAEILHRTNKTKFSLCGWVELFQEDYELFFYIVEQNSELAVSQLEKLPIFASLKVQHGTIIHEPNNIELIYNL